MKLHAIVEARLNVAARQAIQNGTEVVYDQVMEPGRVVIRKLTTALALQNWSRKSCPGWNLGDENDPPICTVVLHNAEIYLEPGPAYYVEVDGKPTVMSTPANKTYFYYPHKEYWGTPDWLIQLIEDVARI